MADGTHLRCGAATGAISFACGRARRVARRIGAANTQADAESVLSGEKSDRPPIAEPSPIQFANRGRSALRIVDLRAGVKATHGEHSDAGHPRSRSSSDPSNP